MAGMIGVFGGSFDPVHLGHLILADEARAAFNLEQVLWVLTPQPPHKLDRPITTLEDRMRMLEVAIADHPAFALSRADIDRDPPHFAIGTLDWLRESQPEREWMYLMGSDSLQDLPEWHNPVMFVNTCDALGVMRRPGADIRMQSLEIEIPGITAKVRFFDAPLIQISSRDLRFRVRKGLPYRYYTLPGVADIIHQRQLYL